MPLRSGDSYRASLADGRRVIHDGEWIDDVAASPLFRRQVSAVAEFYDFQTRPELSELMTFATEDGQRAGMAFLEPRTLDDLRRRAAAYSAWAEVTCGLLGRSPDYMNSMLTQLAGLAAARSGTPMADRFRRLYLRARDEDTFWTHTFIQPFNRHQAPGHAAALRVVRRSADGVFLTGARGLATAGPYANNNLNYEPVRARPGWTPVPGEALHLSFAVPVSAPGLTWVCRDIHTDCDAPLAGADEVDAVALFEEVFVPFDDLAGHAEDFAALAEVVQFFSPWQEQLTFHQTLVRNIAKTKLLLGVAHLLAENCGAQSFPKVQERLGDFVLCLDLLEGLAVAALERAERDEASGWWLPHARYSSAGIRLFGEYYPRLLDHIMMLGASRFVSTPQDATMEVLGHALDGYLGDSREQAGESVRLYRLAWELVGASFGRRQDLYERFFAGGYEMRRAAAYVRMDKGEVVAAVRRLLAPGGAPGASPLLAGRNR